MEIFNVKNLDYKYATEDRLVLENVNVTIQEGEFVLLCGASGCGKTTLLKLLKPSITPSGMRRGEIFFKGENVDDISKRRLASEIGFVFQNPDTQIVTDSVRAELAFGLESLGVSSEDMIIRIGEMSNFFGLEKSMDRKINTLSGGEKQLLNLAAVMALKPDVLILDEPTSQLDPLATEKFLSTLTRINRDIGTTIIITAHQLEEIYPLVDMVILMSKGTIENVGVPSELVANSDIELGLPAAVQIAQGLTRNNGVKHFTEMPISIREGQAWLDEYMEESQTSININKNLITETNDVTDFAIELKDVSFRYERYTQDVLKDVNVKFKKSAITAITGGNGSGKSTTLRIITGSLKPYEGVVKVEGKKMLRQKDFPLGENGICYLPQNPKALFTGITVEENLPDEKLLKQLNLYKYKTMHPYDLSGGQMQKLAIGMLLNVNPSILLLDEPSKGLDPLAKYDLSNTLKELARDKTIIVVSHDLDFVASTADYVCMCFDKRLVGMKEVHEFFANNYFYTTVVRRICKKHFKDAITVKEVVGNE